MFSRGQIAESSSYNNAWSGYMNSNFQAPEYAAKQMKFNSQNTRMNEAITNKIKKS